MAVSWCELFTEILGFSVRLFALNIASDCIGY